MHVVLNGKNFDRIIETFHADAQETQCKMLRYDNIENVHSS